MLKHDWNVCTDLACDIPPTGARPKRKGSWRRWPEGCREQNHGVDVSIQHDLWCGMKMVVRVGHSCKDCANLVLLASEVTQFETPIGASTAIFGCRGLKKVQPVIHEIFRIFTGGTEIDQRDLVGYEYNRRCRKQYTDLLSGGVPQEIGPVWVSLHQSELEELPQTKLDNAFCDLLALSVNREIVIPRIPIPRYVPLAAAPRQIALRR